MTQLNNKNSPLWMRRENLEKIPEFTLPKNFFLRSFRPGDEEIWRQIQTLADAGQTFTRDSFKNTFGSDVFVLRRRQLFLFVGSGTPIGTVTAWCDDYFSNPNEGRVHWLAVVPSFQGQGLGKTLLSACLRRLRELGYQSAYLKTWPTRLAAINLYLQFGFLPWIQKPEEREIWAALRPELRT